MSELPDEKNPKIQIGVPVEITWEKAQKILPNVQKFFNQKVTFIFMQDGRMCLVHHW